MATHRDIIQLDDKEIVGHVTEDFKLSEKAREPINQQNLINLKAFYAIDLNKPFNTSFVSENNNHSLASTMLSNENIAVAGNAFYPPFARSVILAYWALISGDLFPTEEDWLEIMQNEKLDTGSADAFQQIARTWYREMDYVSEADMAIIQALTMDVSVLHTGWLVEPDYIPQVKQDRVKLFDVVSNLFKRKKKLEMKYVPDGRSMPDFWTVNTFNLRVSPGAGHGALNRSNPMFIGYTVKMNKAEFHRRVAGGMFSECSLVDDEEKDEDGKKRPGMLLKIGDEVIDDMEPCGGSSGDTSQDFERIIWDDIKSDNVEQTGIDRPDVHNYRIDLYWQKFGHVMVINNKYVAHKERTDGWQQEVVRSYEQLGTFSGRPIMTDLVEIQHDIISLHRTRRDEQGERAYPIRQVDVSKFKSEDEAMSLAAGLQRVVPYNSAVDPENRTPPISLLEYRHPLVDTLTEEKELMAMGERVVGLADADMGVFHPGQRTATESLHRKQGSGVRSGKIIKEMRRRLIIWPTYRLYILGQLYSTREFRFRVAGVDGGTKWVAYTNDDWLFNSPPDIRAIGLDVMEDRMTDAQLFMNALTFTMQDPRMAQLVKILPSMVTLFRKMGIENPETFIQTDQDTNLMIPPQYELQLIVAGANPPLSPRHDPEEHFKMFNDFIQSEEFDSLSPEAQERVKQRGLQYHQILTAPPPQVGAIPAAQGGLQNPNAAGGLVSGGANAPNPDANTASGQVNRMAGPAPMGR